MSRVVLTLAASTLAALLLVGCGESDDNDNGVIGSGETATATMTETATESATESATETATSTEAAGTPDAGALRDQLAAMVPELGVAFAVDRNPDDRTTTIQTELTSDDADAAQSICDQVTSTGLFPDERVIILGVGDEQVAECGAS